MPTTTTRKEKQTRGALDHHELILKHIPLVKFVLGKVAANLPAWIDREDLLEAGLLGLIDAAMKFDSSREIAFNTYAVVRIRGAMLDEIRNMDWLPRSARDKVDRLRGAERELMLQKQVARPSPRELARILRIPETEVVQLMKMADGHAPISLENSMQNGHVPAAGANASAADPENDIPDENVERVEDRHILTEAIASLPERERRVILLHYYRGMRLREIAELLTLSDSRVGQLRRQALERLKRHIRRQSPDSN